MADLTLSDRAVVITGPAKGMGRALTLAIAEAGADVALLGRDLAPIEAVAGEVCALGRVAIVLEADVTDDDEMAKAVATAADEFGERSVGRRRGGRGRRAVRQEALGPHARGFPRASST